MTSLPKDVRSLLAFDDERFVEAAYVVILRRQPDPGGFSYYVGRRRDGSHRLQLLREISSSEEAQRAGGRVRGMRPAIRLFRLLNSLPLSKNRLVRWCEAGWVLDLCHALDREPTSVAGEVTVPVLSSSEVLSSNAEAQGSSADAAVVIGYANGRLRLHPDRSIDEASWHTYLGALLQERLWKSLRQTVTPPPKAALIVLIEISHSPAIAESLRATAICLRLIQDESKYKVRIYWYSNGVDARDLVPLSGYEDWKSATQQDIETMVGDEDLVLALQPGDEVRPEVHMALNFHGSFDADFTLLDLCIRHNGSIFPFLFHAVDPVHARHCDYFLGRYLANGQLFKSYIARSPDAGLAKIGRTICSQLAAVQTRRHVALPLICINVELSELQQMRAALIRYDRNLSSTTGNDFPPAWSRAKSEQISAVICTKDCGILLRQLLHRLRGERLIADIIIVSNNTTNAHALRNLQDAADMERVTILRYDGPFNFSRQCNLGARYARGGSLLFINDDIVPVSEHWLEQLNEWMDEPRIVGPLLVYPNQSVQHAGMHLGFNGVAGHVLRHSQVPAGDYGFLLTAPRRVSCLTGACMLMPKAILGTLNGFDPMLATYLQDVDLSLRALYSGYELILDPRAILIHMESVSVNPTLHSTAVSQTRVREHNYFNIRWAKAVTHDAWMNPLFDPMDESLASLRI